MADNLGYGIEVRIHVLGRKKVPPNSWQTESAGQMCGMFDSAKACNCTQNINSWQMNSAKPRIASMFFGATTFNQPLDSWRVGSVTSLGDMFCSAIMFCQNADSWQVGFSMDMSGMFSNAQEFNSPLGS